MKINETRIKAGNKIIKTTVEELPLYRINKTQASYLWEDGEFEDYLIYKQIITYSPKYKWLNNTSFTSDSTNANEVLKEFTKYIYLNYTKIIRFMYFKNIDTPDLAFT